MFSPQIFAPCFVVFEKFVHESINGTIIKLKKRKVMNPRKMKVEQGGSTNTFMLNHSSNQRVGKPECEKI